MGWNPATGKLSVDPINRMEGHMGAVCTAQPATGVNEAGYRIVRAELHGNLFRGFELILKGRDPRDAMVLTQRICGVCPIGHGTASSQNIGNLLGFAVHNEDPHSKTPQSTAPVPVAGEALRNLVLAANHLMSHILHFYHLVALDYVNPGLAKPFLCPRYDDNYYITTARILEAANTGLLPPAAVATLSGLPGWGANPGAAVNAYLVGQYLKALDMRRKAHEMGAIFAGKLPIAAMYTAAGATGTIDASRINAFQALLDEIKAFVGEPLDFANGVAGTMMFDTVAAAHLFPEYFWIGNSWGRFMAYGWGESDTSSNPVALTGEMGLVFGQISNSDNRLSKRGRCLSAAPGVTPLSVAAAGMDSDGTARIVEAVKHSRYYNYPDAAYKHPWLGVTSPWPKADAGTGGSKYSWLKSPRYQGPGDPTPLVYEVGPLSRMVVQGLYWGGVLRALPGDPYPLCPNYGDPGLPLNVVGTPFAACYGNQGPDLSLTPYTGDSILDRIAARTIETRVMCDMAQHELNRLVDGASGCTDPAPAISKKGYGMTEASRGALGHWVKTDANGKIKTYQCIVPTTWNGSPRDKQRNPGPAEKALQGNNADAAPLDPSPAGGGVWIADPNQPIEIIRATHSYDFCIACAVHIVKPDGEVKMVVVPPVA